jgi:hypothetical protein
MSTVFFTIILLLSSLDMLRLRSFLATIEVWKFTLSARICKLSGYMVQMPHVCCTLTMLALCDGDGFNDCSAKFPLDSCLVVSLTKSSRESAPRPVFSFIKKGMREGMIAVTKLYACSPCVHAIGSTRSRKGSVDERKSRRERSL